MFLDSTTPLFADPRRLLLEMARERALPDLLRLVVDRLAESPRVALARIWLIRRSEDCGGCVMPAECREPSACLHLVASAGRSVVDPKVEWTRLDGAFRRFPLGERKVGRIAATGEPIEVFDLLPDPPAWAADPAWMRAEGIAGFGGQPLVHRGEVLGVLGVFARGEVGPDCMEWLRAIADGAAAAIATARAFERIEDLTRRLEQENEYLREEVTRTGAFGELVGRGPALEAVARQIDLVAPTDAAVLILGESGTGKELVARLVHWLSPRREAPFIAVNCGGFSETLLESELFGHVKGAFTGAVADKKGLMELADGGTFFLDEVGEMTLSTQVRLLRALETRTFTPVGGTSARRVDLRFVAATNRDLSDMVARRTFREDLYYRLNVIPVRLPALRERIEDIPLLAGHFLSLCNQSFGRSLSGFDAGAVAALKAHRWPGNVRELQNVIQRAASLATGSMVTADDIMHLDAAVPGSIAGSSESGSAGGLPPLADRGFSLDDTLAAIEAKYLSEALDRTGGNLTQAAELLGVTFRSIRYKVQKLGLDRKGR